MDNTVVTLIAVAGTLLGSLLTHVFQRLQLQRTDARSRAEGLRGDRIVVYSDFVQSVAQLRIALKERHRMLERYGAESEQYLRARAHHHLVQPSARGLMYRVHLIADDEALRSLSSELMDATIGIHTADTHDEMVRRAARSGELANQFVQTASNQLQRHVA